MKPLSLTCVLFVIILKIISNVNTTGTLLYSLILKVNSYKLHTDSCLSSDHRRIRLSGPREIKNEGAVQLCVRYNGRDYLWTYISTDGWTNTAAAVACRELGFSSTGEKKLAVYLQEILFLNPCSHYRKQHSTMEISTNSRDTS